MNVGLSIGGAILVLVVAGLAGETPGAPRRTNARATAAAGCSGCAMSTVEAGTLPSGVTISYSANFGTSGTCSTAAAEPPPQYPCSASNCSFSGTNTIFINGVDSGHDLVVARCDFAIGKANVWSSTGSGPGVSSLIMTVRPGTTEPLACSNTADTSVLGWSIEYAEETQEAGPGGVPPAQYQEHSKTVSFKCSKCAN